jgi:hypothetical protein
MSNIIEGTYRLTSPDDNYDSLLIAVGISFNDRRLCLIERPDWHFSQIAETEKWEWVWSSTLATQKHQFAFGETFSELFANSVRVNTVVTLGDSQKLIVTRDFGGGRLMEQTLEFSENGIDVQSVCKAKNVVCKQFFKRL